MSERESQSFQQADRWNSWKTAIVSSVATAGVAAAAFVGIGWRGAEAEPNRPTAEMKADALRHAVGLSSAFRYAAEEVAPAVVTINQTPKIVTEERPGDGADEAPRLPRRRVPDEFRELDPLFKRFFEGFPDLDQDSQDEDAPAPRGPRRFQRGRPSSGSGVLIDGKGVILTNHHVVAGGGKISVSLADGREFPAEDVKSDPDTDIAIVTIKADTPLPFAKLGDSDKVQVGDWVIAVGQPFNLSGTVTAGIISAKQRGPGITQQEEFLQTDAAINPGNSGGPLVNLQGEIIGVNTAISTTSGGYQGIGFAVPVNLAKWAAQQLQSDGKVQRAYLGVGIQPLSPELAEQMGMTVPRGALVNEVKAGSPAEKAGLQVGDVIVELAGVEVKGPAELSAVAARMTIGAKQPLVVIRDGKKTNLTVVIDAMPEGYRTRTARGGRVQVGDKTEIAKYGVTVAPVDADTARTLGLKSPEGALVVAVSEDSSAEAAGLERGMVIEKVGATPIRTVDDLKSALDQPPGPKGRTLLVRTAEGTRIVLLKEPAAK